MCCEWPVKIWKFSHYFKCHLYGIVPFGFTALYERLELEFRSEKIRNSLTSVGQLCPKTLDNLKKFLVIFLAKIFNLLIFSILAKKMA